MHSYLYPRALSVLAVFFMLCINSTVFSHDLSEPEQILQSAVEEIADTIGNDKTWKYSKANVYQLVREKFLPLFNTRRITARSIGRDWLSATDEQKTSLVDSFTDILMLTYSNALTNKSGVRNAFSIRWGRSEVTSKRAMLRSELITQNTVYKINYVLRNGKKGWKVDDILIENLSIFSAYREQFAAILKSGGIPALVAKLQEEQAALAVQ